MSTARALDGRVLAELLGTRELGRSLEVRELVESTNDLAMAAFVAGAKHGHTVVADAQSRGRGRSGAAWLAPARTSILASVLLRAGLGEEASARVTLAAGVALCRALQRHGLPQAELKWPNDILVGRRKVAGILCEGRVLGGAVQALVLGFGINVLQTAGELPPGATSVRVESGGEIGREALLADGLGQLETELGRLAAGGWGEIRQDWEKLSPLHRGHRLQARDGERCFDALSDGLDVDGALLAVRDDGARVRIVSGSVSFH